MSEADGRISVLLVDDHALVRDGVCEILRTQADITVIGEAEDGATAIAVAADRQPDVILLDVEIPGSEVTATVGALRRRSPRSRILILSMHESGPLVRALLSAGVCGYLLKSSRWQELMAAVRAVHLDPERIVLGVSRDSLGCLGPEPADGTLSAREREVIELVARALSNGQVAARLGLTEATVKRHLRNIFAKLGAVSRLDAVNKAKAAW
jgi:DNA-binding NarL/FixJ family response regulator